MTLKVNERTYEQVWLWRHHFTYNIAFFYLSIAVFCEKNKRVGIQLLVEGYYEK
jgi:hypothetical protein